MRSHGTITNTFRRIRGGEQQGGPAKSVELLVLTLIAMAALVWTPRALASDNENGIISRIHREPVDSKGLATVGYSKRLRALEIEFRRGGTYRYLDVPGSVYHEMLAADSKAVFYNEQVRGKYRSVYVRPSRRK